MATITKGMVSEIERHREMFSRDAVVEIILNTGVFSTIDPGDAAMIERRNYGLETLFSMGLLQDSKLPEIVDSWINIGYDVEEDVKDD